MGEAIEVCKELPVGFKKVTHNPVFNFVINPRCWPSPQVHKEHCAPPRCHSACLVLDCDLSVSNWEFFDNHSTELKWSAALGTNEEGFYLPD